ncbi:MAG TPA: carboxypeptidase-like regulatory domain-containing protein [Candidatus Thermoplasmatota archaeon]|nr:carboxypeptidase-like regulatory domain-containing protein [Candidatus Thermoplasmatota archaeon]
MRGWSGLFLIASLVLSGCSSSGASGSGTSSDVAKSLDDIDAKVSATTGAIKGVVVDTAIVPVAGAKVTLAAGATNKSMVADKQGRFVFNELAPGTYFVGASAPLYRSSQTSVEVKAGEPTVTKIQIQAVYSQKPYQVPTQQKGFFECSQGNLYGAFYVSSNCVVDPYRRAQGLPGGSSLPSPSPTQFVDNITSQSREWHSDVGPGWQVQVFEMTWEPSAQGTSPRLKIVVSTDKATRNSAHSFASVVSANPMRFELDVNVTHATAATVEPVKVPPEGMTRMSYFVSAGASADAVCDPVGLWCVPPGVAVNQEFKVFLTQFYYGIPPEGWSFVKGDPYPF